MRNVILFSVLSCFLAGGLIAQDQKPDIAKLKKEAAAAFQAQKWPEAEKALAEILKADPKDGPAWHNYGYALHAQGKLDDALQAHIKAAEFSKGRNKGTAIYNIACVYALKKDADKAFENLEKAVAAGFANPEQLADDSDMNNIRSDPRFAKIVDAVKAASSHGDGGEPMLFNQSTERMSSRAALFTNTGGKGEIHVSWGPVTWKDEYEAHIKSEKAAEHRWRLGADFWTTLDTNLPMTFDKTTVAAGYYYLTIEKKASGEMVLNVLDPVEVRKTMMDAFQSGATKGGMEIPLKHETTTEPAKKLMLAVALDQNDKSKGTITVLFGTHKLSAPFSTGPSK